MADKRLAIIIDAVNNASATLKQVQNDLNQLGATSNKVNKDFKSLGDSFKTLGRGFRQTGLALTAGLTAPLALVGATMIKQVGQIEQFKVALDVMLGSAEEGSRILKDLADFAATTPFDLPGVVQAGRQLLAFGIGADKLLPTVKALGDVAAGTGAELSRIILNFGQVATQGKLTGRELRDFAVLGVPLIGELAKEFGVAKNEIQDMVSAGKVGFADVEKAFINMTSEGGRFFNLMDRQSKTLQGVISNLRDNFVRVSLALFGISSEAENFGEVIEGGVFDVLKGVAEGVLEALDRLVVFLNSLSIETRTTIVTVAALVAALGPLLLILGTLLGAVAAIGAGLATLAGPAGALLVTITVLTAALGTLAAVGSKFIEGFVEASNAQFKELNNSIREQIKVQEESSVEKIRLIEEEQAKILATVTEKGAELTEAQRKELQEQFIQLEGNLRQQKLADIESKVEFIERQKELAETVGGIYDIQNERIITVTEATFRTIIKSTKNAFLSLLGLARLFATTFTSIISNTFKGLGTIVAGTLSDVAGGFRAIISRDFENIPDIIGNTFKRTAEIGKDITEDLDKNFGVFVSQFERGLKDIDSAVETEFNADEQIDKVMKDSVDRLKDGIRSLNIEVDKSGIPSVGEGAEKAEKQVKKLTKEIEDLRKELVDTSQELRFDIRNIGATIKEALGEQVQTEVVNSYDVLKQSIDGVKDKVKELITEHDKFIQQATEGIDDYNKKVEELREEAVQNVVESFRDAQRSLAEINKELEDTADLDREDVAELEEKKRKAKELIASFKELTNESTDFSDKIEEARGRTERLTDNVTRLTEQGNLKLAKEQAEALRDAQIELDILIGKQILNEQNLTSIQKVQQDAELEANLSSIELTALRLAQQERLAEEIRNVQAATSLLSQEELIKKGVTQEAIDEILRIREAIQSGTDVTQLGLSQEAAELALASQEELINFENKLKAQEELLIAFRRREVDLAISTKEELLAIQQELEAGLKNSYDSLIGKLNQLKQAADTAFAAAQRAASASGGRFEGGFDTGGFTGGGNIKDVAGWVHKGEWVAPNWMVKRFGGMFQQLEGMRRTKSKGFEEGGMAGPQQTFHQPITMHNNIQGQADFNAMARFLSWQLRR